MPIDKRAYVKLDYCDDLLSATRIIETTPSSVQRRETIGTKLYDYTSILYQDKTHFLLSSHALATEAGFNDIKYNKDALHTTKFALIWSKSYVDEENNSIHS